MQPCWHILTGEYPPRPGGVADYTALLAGGLADAGVAVHVWTTGAGGPAVQRDPRVAVHRAGDWSPRDLARLGAALDALPAPRVVLAQHVPPLWGYRGMNLAIGPWLRARRAAADDVRVMFHEVRYYARWSEKPTRWLLSVAQRRMVRDLLAAATQAYVSTPAWEPLLRRHGPAGRRVAVHWLPVPSNIPVRDDAAAVAALRRRLAPAGGTLIGTFGTFASPIAARLGAILPALLRARTDRRALLLGRGGADGAAALAASHPALAGQFEGPGDLPAADLSLYIQACDLFVQPYPDGVTSRRTSAMAALAHGRPVATNAGPLTEPCWADSGAVALAASPDPDDLTRAAAALLDDPGARARLGSAGRRFYDRAFALERLVAALLDPARAPAGPAP